MKKLVFLVIALAIGALFLVPESIIGEYKGLLKVKYTLRDAAISIKNIATEFARTGEKPEELDSLEQSVREKLDVGAEQLIDDVKDAAKDAAKETIEGL